MKYCVILFLLLPISVFSQRKQNKISTDSIISKWNHAIVNLEMRGNSASEIESEQLISNYTDSLRNKQMYRDKVFKIIDSIRSAYMNKYSQSTGTAIFLKYEGKRYLVTARHVLWDKEAYIEENKLGLINQYNQDEYLNRTFTNILRIPIEGEPEVNGTPFIFLLGTRGRYIFSNLDEDLAIISLDEDYKSFADLLEKKGSNPISINDIDTLCNLKYGQDISVFGFPFFTWDNQFELSQVPSYWTSQFVFVNSVTFGKISSISLKKYCFIGDANIAPGNSGGAIISGNKLIGIVSAQPVLNLEHDNGNS